MLVALLVLGNYVMWLGRPQAVEPGAYTPAGAAVYVEMIASADDNNALARITSGPTNEIQVTDAHLIGTARTPQGDVDLVTFRGTDNTGADYTCLGTIEQSLSGSMCAAAPTEDIQVNWGETTNADSPFGDSQYRSVTVFNAPQEAAAVFVLLDGEGYVGADVLDGASHVTWPSQTGGFDQLIILDTAGNEIHRQTLRS